MTIDEVYELLNKIGSTGGLDESMLEDLKRVKDSFDEREGELKRYREEYKGEDWKSRAVNAEKERDEIKEKYIKRFLGINMENRDYPMNDEKPAIFEADERRI